MTCSHLIFNQSEHLIKVVHIYSKLNDKQCRSRSVGFFRSQLIWIYTVFKGWIYPGSARQGLRVNSPIHLIHIYHKNVFVSSDSVLFLSAFLNDINVCDMTSFPLITWHDSVLRHIFLYSGKKYFLLEITEFYFLQKITKKSFR